MTLSLQKISPTHHLFEYETKGKRVSLELETKTYLFHDLLHFAVESEAGLKNSFYGLLTQGENYNELSMRPRMEGAAPVPQTEAATTEVIVGIMTGAVQDNANPQEALAAAGNLFGAYGLPVPSYLTEAFILRVKERLRELLGHWRGTPFGQAMELEFSMD